MLLRLGGSGDVCDSVEGRVGYVIVAGCRVVILIALKQGVVFLSGVEGERARTVGLCVGHGRVGRRRCSFVIVVVGYGGLEKGLELDEELVFAVLEHLHAVLELAFAVLERLELGDHVRALLQSRCCRVVVVVVVESARLYFVVALLYKKKSLYSIIFNFTAKLQNKILIFK